MIRAQRLLPNLDGALKQAVGLRITPYPLIDMREIVEARGHVDMLWTERRLSDRECPLGCFLNLDKAALILIDLGEIIEDQRHLETVRSVHLLGHSKRSLVLRLRLRITRLV